MDKQWYLDQLSGDLKLDCWNSTSWMHLIALSVGEGIDGPVDEEIQELAQSKMMDGVRYRIDLEHSHNTECRWLDLHAQLACDVIVGFIDGTVLDADWFNRRLKALGLSNDQGVRYNPPWADKSFPRSQDKCPEIKCNLWPDEA